MWRLHLWNGKWIDKRGIDGTELIGYWKDLGSCVSEMIWIEV